MALDEDLKKELRQILANFKGGNDIVSVPGGAGKALEAWVLMRLAQTADGSGDWHVSLRRGDGTLLPMNEPFRFATSQHGIGGQSSSAPSYVLLDHKHADNQKLELHGSLQWQGRSGATHEIDVSIVPAVIANALRVWGGGLPNGLPILAVECKDKTGSGTPDEMRETLARMFDLTLVTKPEKQITCRVFENIGKINWGRWRRTYRGFFKYGTFAIVRVGPFSPGARRIAAHYSIQRIGGVYDGEQAIQRLEDHFRGTLATLHEL